MSTLAPSIQLYTLRDYLEKDFAGTIAKVATLGLTQVEPWGFADRADEYAEVLATNGLKAPTGHAAMIDQDLAPIFAAAKKLGMTTVIDPFTLPETWKDRAKIDHYAAEINRAAVEARAHGIRVGYHNHGWELSERVDGKIAFDYFIEQLLPEVVIELDTYWCEVGGQNAAEYLSKLGDRVVAIHVKDGKIFATDDFMELMEHQCPAGQGDVPVAAILAAAPNALPVVEFDKYVAGDLFEGIAQSLTFINGARA